MKIPGNIHVLVLTLFLALSGCSERSGVVELRIVATSDVHGMVFDQDCLDGSQRDGSLAQMASFLKRERKEHKKVLYVDAGDILKGSVEMYQDLSSQFVRESLAAKAYNLLGCDVMVSGNHDLEADGTSYERFFRSAGFPVLGANVYFEEYGDFLPPYKMFDYKGLRVAVIGMTTPVVKYSIPWDRIRDLEVSDIVTTAKYWMPILREDEKADVVVGLIHSGFDNGRMDDEGVYENEVRRLVSEVPGFDIIVFGHDHKARCLKMADCNGDSVLLMNPGAFAINAAVATVKADFRNPVKPEILTSGYLQDITCEVPDRKFLKNLSGWYNDVKTYSDSIIGSVATQLEGNGVLWRESSAMDYIHFIQLRYNSADISLSSPLFTRTLFPAGEIRIHDLFALYRYENTMATVMLKGSEVKDVLEYSAGLFYNTVADGSDNLLKTVTGEDGTKYPQESIKNLITAAGIAYTIDVTKPEGERVTVLSMNDGSPFVPERFYRTTISSFLYGGDESALFKATGLLYKDMKGRLDSSSMADIRYYMITDFALRHEMGNQVRVRRVSDWRLVPEQMAGECLAHDTLRFSVIKRH